MKRHCILFPRRAQLTVQKLVGRLVWAPDSFVWVLWSRQPTSIEAPCGYHSLPIHAWSSQAARDGNSSKRSCFYGTRTDALGPGLARTIRGCCMDTFEGNPLLKQSKLSLVVGIWVRHKYFYLCHQPLIFPAKLPTGAKSSSIAKWGFVSTPAYYLR